MKIYEVPYGYVVEDGGGALPGVYATEEVARRATTINIAVLERLARTRHPIRPQDIDRVLDPHDSVNQIDIYETPLVPGRRYRVTWNDCCAEGWFEGVFVKGDANKLDDLTFDCGVVSTLAFGQTWITPAG